jgi:hypothetical protein
MKTSSSSAARRASAKPTTCRGLQKILPRNVFPDGDWCWDMRPFVVTGETKKMAESNIAHLLNSFLDCPEFESVIFCWVLHQQKINAPRRPCTPSGLADRSLSSPRTWTIALSEAHHPRDTARRTGRSVDAYALRQPDYLARGFGDPCG